MEVQQEYYDKSQTSPTTQDTTKSKQNDKKRDFYKELTGFSIAAEEEHTRESSRGFSADITLQELQYQAAVAISTAWQRYQMRKIFSALKQIVSFAESGLTLDMMKKINPRELHLLKDPFTQGRVRFRFGGTTFPPTVYYKIFSKGLNVHYFNARNMIEPGSQAARDSCNVMGRRKFLEQVVADENFYADKVLCDPVQITCKKEYITYTTLMDEVPSQLGGRNNNWREISLSEFPAHHMFYDLTTIKRALVKKTIQALLKPNISTTDSLL